MTDLLVAYGAMSPMDVCGSPWLPWLCGALLAFPLGLVVGAVSRITLTRLGEHSQQRPRVGPEE